jgi:hypothetical protein
MLLRVSWKKPTTLFLRKSVKFLYNKKDFTQNVKVCAFWVYINRKRFQVSYFDGKQNFNPCRNNEIGRNYQLNRLYSAQIKYIKYISGTRSRTEFLRTCRQQTCTSIFSEVFSMRLLFSPVHCFVTICARYFHWLLYCGSAFNFELYNDSWHALWLLLFVRYF